MAEQLPETLGDVAEIVMGQSPAGETCNRKGIGVPLLNGPTEFGSHHPLATQFTVDPRKHSQAGDILFCVRGSTTGRMNWSDRPYAIGRGIAAIRHRGDPEIQPLVRSIMEYNLPSLLQAATGSTFPNVSAKQLAQIPYPRIDEGEQRRVASLFGALDDKIYLNRRTNQTLEAIARALFKDWFVDFGPTRAKMEGRDAYLAPDLWALFPDRLDDETGLPDGWESESIYDQAEWVNGAAYKNMHFSDAPDALPVVKIAELKAGVTDRTQFTNTQLGNKYKIDSGELLFSWSGNPDTSIDAFIWQYGPAWLNQHIFAVRDIGKMSKSQIYCMLKAHMPEFAEIARNKQTTGLGHVTKADMQRMTICTASRAVREKFDEIIKPSFDRLVSNLFESRELVKTRDLLLPKLMSGEIRLRDAEKIAGEAL